MEEGHFYLKFLLRSKQHLSKFLLGFSVALTIEFVLITLKIRTETTTESFRMGDYAHRYGSLSYTEVGETFFKSAVFFVHHFFIASMLALISGAIYAYTRARA